MLRKGVSFVHMRNHRSLVINFVVFLLRASGSVVCVFPPIKHSNAVLFVHGFGLLLFWSSNVDCETCLCERV